MTPIEAAAVWLPLTDPTEDETPVLVRRLRDAEGLIELLRRAASMLTLELAARLEHDVTPFPGVGLVTRGYTRRSEWRDENASADLRRDVGEAVAAQVALDVGTGEVDPLRRNIARATIDALYEVLPAFSSVKAPARKLGIRISDYRIYSDVAVIHVTDLDSPDPTERNHDD